jgi:cytochrome c553
MNRIALGFALMLGLTAAHAGGDAKAGQELAKSKACVTCHGEQGNKPSAPDQPVLAGQYQDYLMRALMDYKSGRRTNPIMKGFAGQLSSKDIEDLAAWFSSQKDTSLHNQR